MRVWDESQANSFLIAAQGSRYEAFYHLALRTGMRQAELMGLMWADLHWTRGDLFVRRQAQRLDKGSWHFAEPKTKHGTRTIRLFEGTLQVLREHQFRQQYTRAIAGERWQEMDLIFTSNAGTPIDRSNMRLDFNRVIQEAGLPKIRFHDLRHTAASLMLNHNIPVIVVSRILGHSTPSITLDIYGHLYTEMQDEAARLMDELLTPAQGGYGCKGE
jgi:integrase